MNGFFLSLYARSSDHLTYANVVRLLYCQSNSFLGASCHPSACSRTLTIKDGKEWESVARALEGPATKATISLGGKQVPPGAALDREGANLLKGGKTQFPLDLGFSWAPAIKPPYLKKAVHESYDDVRNLWSKACWLVENCEDRLSGGPVQWKGGTSKPICLRHLGSGRYLSVGGAKFPSGEPVPQNGLCAGMQRQPDSSCWFWLDPIEPPESGAGAAAKEAAKYVSSSRVRALLCWQDPKTRKEYWLSSGGRRKNLEEILAQQRR